MTTMTTRKPTYKSEILGTVTLNLYTDPHPGRDAKDRVPVPCAKCGGTGRIEAFGYIDGGRCWDCNGHGQSSISVGTARKYARSEAFALEYGDQIDAYWRDIEEKNRVAREAAEWAAAWDEAHTENARRATLNQTVMGQEGDKLADIEVTVEVAKSIEVPGYRYGTDWKRFVVLKTADGQVAKVFGTAECLWKVERGDRAVIRRATVKRHDEYQGQKQTELTRVKLEKIEPADD
ncbi:hypothetical protein [Mycolicibacterium fortuitum]|uniref:hypothetical protein n=1 Tax=Mycolicibacterium fortuitum TaxID=1766 RepID=UPI001162F842|nr:hypothetical protein [Mycolicibacterium fortuitum]QDF19397.1 hypothetical protein SEA_CRACKLEWINK_111 [Mycobacterium phage Cracklewink]UBV14825.1 hypothetical protein H8Z57_29715 [Mycolicibacterium fortuitum]